MFLLVSHIFYYRLHTLFVLVDFWRCFHLSQHHQICSLHHCQFKTLWTTKYQVWWGQVFEPAGVVGSPPSHHSRTAWKVNFPASGQDEMVCGHSDWFSMLIVIPGSCEQFQPFRTWRTLCFILLWWPQHTWQYISWWNWVLTSPKCSFIGSGSSK